MAVLLLVGGWPASAGQVGGGKLLAATSSQSNQAESEKMFVTVAVAVLLAQTTPVQPMENAAEDVVVVGSREGYRINMRALRAAQSAFARQRNRYAPESSLLFLIERFRNAAAKPPQLYWTDGTRRLPIPLGDGGSFGLPATPPGKWWLETNLMRGQAHITPLTLSPKSSRRDYRLGDARLQCRVLWTMEKATAPILAAPIIGMADVAGPCTNRKIGIYVTAPGPIRTAVLEQGSRTIPVAVGRSGRSYRLPVDDQTFGDEARIRITTD